jgi:UDP:flavonoid glycosyltransferase YjiC (YdhE family)
LPDVRILFVTAPAHGHFHPLGPLARALVERGHQVAFATGPDFCKNIERYGFDTLVAGPTEAEMGPMAAHAIAEARKVPPSQFPVVAFPLVFGKGVAPATLPDLLARIREWKPSLLVHETASLAAPIAAAVAGIPSVNQSYGTVVPRAVAEAAALAVVPLWKQHELEPEPFAGLYRGLYLDICPPTLQFDELQHIQSLQRLRPIPFDEPRDETLPAWMASQPDRPTVYVTLGTVFGATPVFSTVLTALREEPIDLVVTVGFKGDPAALGPQPDHVHIERYIPQTRLLPRCRLVVSHAGSGTLFSALSHGIPTLALPQGADQFRNAERLAATGAGRVLMPPQVDVDSVRREVRSLLSDDRYTTGAARLREEIRAMPSPSEVAATLEPLGG